MYSYIFHYAAVFEMMLAKLTILFQNTMQYQLKLSYLSVFLWLFAKD
jgi:hypothetical protein